MNKNLKVLRKIQKSFKSQGMMEGAGVLIHRSIGTSQLRNLDPFLMLDEFKNDDPKNYMEGFPDHPHRGFETVTYMLKGSFEHRDHMGNVGQLKDGAVQWMTAGAGVIHSEMPKQTEGMVWGFQMWINLPAKDKMCKPRYQDIQPENIPSIKLENGTTIKVMAGTFKETTGPINGIATSPVFLDVRLPSNTVFEYEIPKGHTCFNYLFDGKAKFGDQEKLLEKGSIVVYEREGDFIKIETNQEEAQFLLAAAKPLNEPIFQRGPFVMASQEDLMQAFIDYQTGMFLKRAKN